ncbi:hypothetical protein F4677DRAFT_447733 [Hypoxylon crocopeplum]|nr:hypothetical protein F4677DRAFT_447733 [Hypoxylon crocopeplum]
MASGHTEDQGLGGIGTEDENGRRVKSSRSAASLDSLITSNGPSAHHWSSFGQSLSLLQGQVRELAELRKLTLAFLVCIVKQEKNPLHSRFSIEVTPASTPLEDRQKQLHGPSLIWDKVRRRLDELLRGLSVWSTGLRDDKLSLIESDGGLDLIVDCVVTSLLSFTRRLMHVINTESWNTEEIDPVLVTVAEKLKANVKYLESKDTPEDCPHCANRATDRTAECDNVEQLQDLFLGLQQDTMPLQRALRRKDFLQQTVGVPTVTKSAHFEGQEPEEDKLLPVKNESSPRITAPLKSKRRTPSLSEPSRCGPSSNLLSGPSYLHDKIELDSVHWEEGDRILLRLQQHCDTIPLVCDLVDASSFRHVLALMTTDLSVFEPEHMQIELARLQDKSQGSGPMNDADLAAEFGMKLDLTGNNLPQDIVTALVEAVPPWREPVFESDDPPHVAQSRSRLRAARLLLDALPRGKVHVEETNTPIATRLMTTTYIHLIKQTISFMQGSFNVVKQQLPIWRRHRPVCQFINLLQSTVSQLLTINPYCTDIFIQEYTQLLEELLAEFNALLGSSNAQLRHWAMDMKHECTVYSEDTIVLPRVHFLLHVIQRDPNTKQPPPISISDAHFNKISVWRLLENSRKSDNASSSACDTRMPSPGDENEIAEDKSDRNFGC